MGNSKALLRRQIHSACTYLLYLDLSQEWPIPTTDGGTQNAADEPRLIHTSKAVQLLAHFALIYIACVRESGPDLQLVPTCRGRMSTNLRHILFVLNKIHHGVP